MVRGCISEDQREERRTQTSLAAQARRIVAISSESVLSPFARYFLHRSPQSAGARNQIQNG